MHLICVEKAVQKLHQQYSTVIVLNLSKTEQMLRIMNSNNDTDELQFNWLLAPCFLQGWCCALSRRPSACSRTAVLGAGQELLPWVLPAPLQNSRHHMSWACCTRRVCWFFGLCINHLSKIRKFQKMQHFPRAAQNWEAFPLTSPHAHIVRDYGCSEKEIQHFRVVAMEQMRIFLVYYPLWQQTIRIAIFYTEIDI